MKAFFQTARLLVSDLASSLVFLAAFSVTHNTAVSACLGIAFGLGQIIIQYMRGKSIDVMEWLSLFLVIGSGIATMLTDNPRFILFKPSVIYVIVGIAMLKPGWINRYLPEIAKAVAADAAIYTGFAWAALMFVSAVVNIYLAETRDLLSWASDMATFGVVSKVTLGVAGFMAIRLTARKRLRAMPAEERDALLLATGWRTERPATAATI